LQMTALANVLIGFTAIALSKKGIGDIETAVPPHPGPLPKGEGEAAAASRPLTPATGTRLTILVALTGGVSMGLEILASRSLSLIFGASVQAFAIVLMAFILGIGLGSAAIASPRLKRWNSESLIFTLLLMAAGLVGVLVLGIEQWVEAYRYMLTGLGRTPIGYSFYQIITGAFSI